MSPRSRTIALAVALAVRVFCGPPPVAAAAGAPALRIAPYVQAVNASSATVLWKPASGAPGRVEYGLSPTYGASAEGHEVSTPRGERFEPDGGGDVEASLHGLKPNAVYHYRVVLATSSSEDRTFRTAPTDSTAPVRFVVYGDSRSNPGEHARVASAAARLEPAFVLYTGDIVPSADADELTWSRQFFEPAEPLLRKAPLFFTWGNHEEANPLVSLYFRGPDGMSVPDSYSFDWGPVHVVTINTNKTYAPGSQQYKFLSADLAATKAPFKIVFAHHPTYSSGIHGSTKDMQEYLQPLFESRHVQLVLSGHEHNYERSVVKGVTYVVTGGGGAPLYPQIKVAKNPFSVVFRQAFNFVQVDASSTALTLDAWIVNETGAPTAADRVTISP